MAIPLVQREDLVRLNWSADGFEAKAPDGLGFEDYEVRRSWRGWEACRGKNASSRKLDTAEDARAFITRDFNRLVLARSARSEWLPMQIAPDTGWAVLAKVRDDIAALTGDQRYEAWAGQQIVVVASDPAEAVDEPLWDMAAPAGAAGMPQSWFAGWLPLADPLPPRNLQIEHNAAPTLGGVRRDMDDLPKIADVPAPDDLGIVAPAR